MRDVFSIHIRLLVFEVKELYLFKDWYLEKNRRVKGKSLLE